MVVVDVVVVVEGGEGFAASSSSFLRNRIAEKKRVVTSFALCVLVMQADAIERS
jgi:hypothetical protein